jgi:uncharacterized cofD-like protein
VPASLPVRVVAVGGGHGLSRALEALRIIAVEPTAIVTVADDGGSSGRLRRDRDVIALGDLRMALLTLARHERLAAPLGHRFDRGELEGHALGNLLLLALIELLNGDVVAALDEAGLLLDCAGRVLPATPASVQLKAHVSGEEVDGQVRVATATGRVDRVWLEPAEAPASPQAVTAIDDAELVLLGPGSLFTSVIAAVLVPEIAAALLRTRARIAYLANIVTQPGETSELDAEAHVRALLAHVPGLQLDSVLLHDGPVPSGCGQPLGTTVDRRVVPDQRTADVAARAPDGTPLAGHDPARLAVALEALVTPGA